MMKQQMELPTLYDYRRVMALVQTLAHSPHRDKSIRSLAKEWGVEIVEDRSLMWRGQYYMNIWATISKLAQAALAHARRQPEDNAPLRSRRARKPMNHDDLAKYLDTARAAVELARYAHVMVAAMIEATNWRLDHGEDTKDLRVLAQRFDELVGEVNKLPGEAEVE